MQGSWAIQCSWRDICFQNKGGEETENSISSKTQLLSSSPTSSLGVFRQLAGTCHMDLLHSLHGTLELLSEHGAEKLSRETCVCGFFFARDSPPSAGCQSITSFSCPEAPRTNPHLVPMGLGQSERKDKCPDAPTSACAVLAVHHSKGGSEPYTPSWGWDHPHPGSAPPAHKTCLSS